MAWWLIVIAIFVVIEATVLLFVWALFHVADHADQDTDREARRLPPEPRRVRRRRGSVCSTRRR